MPTPFLTKLAACLIFDPTLRINFPTVPIFPRAVVKPFINRLPAPAVATPTIQFKAKVPKGPNLPKALATLPKPFFSFLPIFLKVFFKLLNIFLNTLNMFVFLVGLSVGLW